MTSSEIGMIIYLSLSLLITTITIRASKWHDMKLFMVEDADLLLGDSKFAKQGDRTKSSSPNYEEGESDPRKMKDDTKSPIVLHRCYEKAIRV